MKKRLKIAMMVASEVAIPMPKKFPRAFASIPIAIAIAEEMAKRGHKVFFFASKDSKPQKFKLIKGAFVSFYKNKNIDIYKLSEHVRSKIIGLFDQYLFSLIYKNFEKEKFDIIHFHEPINRSAFPIARMFPNIPVVYTIHDPLIIKWKIKIHRFFGTEHQHLISVSDAQRKPTSSLNWTGTVHHGIDIKSFPFNKKPKDYLFFAGRILARKGAYKAIQAAKTTKSKLLIAGDYYSKKEYWRKKIKPNLSDKIKYVGFVSSKKLIKFYQNAKVLLFPIKWEEPFGLVMIEAMACGTPVIAFNRGSVPEIIKDGETGFIVKNTAGMIKAIEKINQMPKEEYEKMRYNCRRHVEENFSIEKMVDNYEKVYYKILASKKRK